jgi:putative tryptophan/tyrosine transport system substrate-binding protein
MKRRDVIALLAGAAIMPPRIVTAQSPEKMRRVGMLYPLAKEDRLVAAVNVAFRAELSRLGWKEGDNLRIEERPMPPDPPRVHALVMELVGTLPDAIYVVGVLGLSYLHKATQTIPIVFVNVPDPVGQGYASSLARPSGNITGFTNLDVASVGKWLELIKEASPQVTRVFYMFNPDTAPYIRMFEQPFIAAARTLHLEIAQAPVRDTAEIEHVIGMLAGESGAGLVVALDIYNYIHHKLIVELALQAHVPTIYGWKEAPIDGGLMSYGSDNLDLVRRAASYIDRILRGARPGELPIQQPIKFELVINLKAAAAIGLSIPSSLLARADEVIE